jgi:uncharacterized protein YegL
MSGRRLPVYLLSALRTDPYALESVHISIITFDISARELFALTPLDEIQLPEITVPQAGATFLGAALELLVDRVDRHVMRTTPDRKGDWRPLLFVMTDGTPSDMQAYRDAIVEVKRRNFGNIVVCAAGPKARIDVLEELSGVIVHLETTDSSSFASFFKWVSASVSIGSSSAGVIEPTVLPPPPPEVQVVL